MRLSPPRNWKTLFKVSDRTLVVTFASSRRAISSAVYGGGISRAEAVLNHQVDPDPSPLAGPFGPDQKYEDPSRFLGRVARGLGVKGRCIGLMTAVDIRRLVLKRQAASGIWVEGFFTVGVTNAVRAGELTEQFAGGRGTLPIGTINIILVTNGRLSVSAMVGAVGVATESKAAVLFEEKVPSSSGSLLATGTGTDTIVIVSGDGPSLRFSGTHTKIGELIGGVVRCGVKQGLQDMIKTSKVNCG